MAGETALDTSIAIRYLNGAQTIVERVIALQTVVLQLPVVGELLFGAENSARPLQNLTRYLQFIEFCVVVPMGRETARAYSQTRLSLRRKGRPIPENDMLKGIISGLPGAAALVEACNKLLPAIASLLSLG